MPRNYSSIEMDIAVTGFFSEYLPSCFKIGQKFFLYPPSQKCDLIPPVCFTMSRYNGNDARRNIFIPEIGSYVLAQQYMKQEHIIQELIEFSETSDVSFSPLLGSEDSIVRHEQSYGQPTADNNGISSNYIENVAKKIVRSVGAKHILKLDISNCFSSFYMHMIPAILLGKETAEAEYNKTSSNISNTIKPLYLKYAKLDSIIRRQNLNRTNGLLTGTLYSKIIAEAILTRVDKELKDEKVRFSRYVDDYEVYLNDNREEKQTISLFEKTLKRYGFTLNSEKTELIDFPYYISENLEQIFQGQLTDHLSNADIMKLFNSFLSLEKSGAKGAIRYLLKSIEKSPIETSNTELYKAYLLTILSNNERSLTKACSLLIKDRANLQLDQSDVDFIKHLLHAHLECEHDLEVIWLTYLLIQTDNLAKAGDIAPLIVASNNELAQILLVRRNLLSDAQLDQIKVKAASWILLYELYSSGRMDEHEFVNKLNINQNLSMYQHFKKNNLHFVNFEDDQ